MESKEDEEYKAYRATVMLDSAKRLGTLAGRGWELSPADQTHERQILNGQHDTATVKHSDIYLEYKEKNKPVTDAEQVQKIKAGFSQDHQEGALVKAIANKMAQTNYLDPAEQSLMDYYTGRAKTSGTAAEKLLIYDTVLHEVRNALAASQQPINLSPLPQAHPLQPEARPIEQATPATQTEPLAQNPIPEPTPIINPIVEPAAKHPLDTPASSAHIPADSKEQTVDWAFYKDAKEQTVDWVFYKVDDTLSGQPGDQSHETSYAENLRFFEGIEASEYELLLPAEFESIREYLKNDGYLSNQEISAALYDASLTKEELAHKVDTIGGEKTDDQTKERITDYLWDIHQTVMDSPFRDLDPAAQYHVTAIEQRPAPPLDAALELNQKREEQKQAKNPQKDEDGIVRTALKLKVFEGGLLANLLHNYKTMALLIDKLTGVHALTDQKQKPQNKIMETPVLAPRYSWEQIEKDFKGTNITKDLLEKSGNLNDFLNGRRTGILTMNQNDGAGTLTPFSGKMYIHEIPGQGPRVGFIASKEEIRLPNSYLGHTLTPDDKKNLLSGKEMGRPVELTDKVTSEKFMAFVGLDTENNKLTVLRQDRVRWPETLLGAAITPQQKATLKEGKAIRLEGMTGKDGNVFSADVRISAAKRSFQFMKVPEQAQKQTVSQEVKQPPLTKQQKQEATRQKGETPDATGQKAQQKKKETPAQKAGSDPNTKKAVSVVSKNGQSRVSTAKTAGATTQKSGAKQTPGKKQQETIVNGATKENQAVKGLKAKPKSKLRM